MSEVTIEQPVEEWTDAKLAKFAKDNLSESESCSQQAIKAGTRSVLAYLRAGQAYRLLRARHKATGHWTAFMKDQQLPEASVREAIAFADRAETSDEKALLACRSLTEARTLLGLADESGNRQPRTQRSGPNKGNIKGMTTLERAADSLDALVAAIGTKKHGPKIAAKMKWDDAKAFADRLRDDLAKLDEWLEAGAKAAAAAAVKTEEAKAKEALAA